jgi:hypothetical protein
MVHVPVEPVIVTEFRELVQGPPVEKTGLAVVLVMTNTLKDDASPAVAGAPPNWIEGAIAVIFPVADTLVDARKYLALLTVIPVTVTGIVVPAFVEENVALRAVQMAVSPGWSGLTVQVATVARFVPSKGLFAIVTMAVAATPGWITPQTSFVSSAAAPTTVLQSVLNPAFEAMLALKVGVSSA